METIKKVLHSAPVFWLLILATVGITVVMVVISMMKAEAMPFGISKSQAVAIFIIGSALYWTAAIWLSSQIHFIKKEMKRWMEKMKLPKEKTKKEGL